MQLLVDGQISNERQKIIAKMFENLKKPFTGLNTKWQKLKKYKNIDNFVPSKHVVIGTDKQLKIKKNLFISRRSNYTYQ